MQQSADFIHSLQIFSSLFSGSEHWHNAHSFFTCASFRFSVTNMITYEKEYLNSSVNLLNSSYRKILSIRYVASKVILIELSKVQVRWICMYYLFNMRETQFLY